MQTITTVGLDIAKSVFQVHGVDADGQVVVRRYSRSEIWWEAASGDVAEVIRLLANKHNFIRRDMRHQCRELR